MDFTKNIKINDKRTAYLAALTEMRQYDYVIKSVNLALPDVIPQFTFYCFFEDPVSKNAYCRTYMYNKRTVSFVKILNYEKLKKENPLLVENYLQNGVFLYRRCELVFDKWSRLKSSYQKSKVIHPYKLVGKLD